MYLDEELSAEGDGRKLPAQETQHSHPSLSASRFVHRYIQRKGRLHGDGMTISVIARSCALLDFELGDIWQIRSCRTGLTQTVEPVTLVGLETYVQNQLLVSGNFESFAIQFRPAALKQLFRIANA
ncbi:MAG: hypothetical protein JO210_04960 [Acidobacteriaceae bacterium]|nr:hypothetical protein [Acidobacteriaceae bacterium]